MDSKLALEVLLNNVKGKGEKTELLAYCKGMGKLMSEFEEIVGWRLLIRKWNHICLVQKRQKLSKSSFYGETAMLQTKRK